MHIEFQFVNGLKLGIEHTDGLVGIDEDGDGQFCSGIIVDLLIFRFVVAFPEDA